MTLSVAILLSIAILFGGGTSAGFIGDIVVQALSLIIICLFVLFAAPIRKAQLRQILASRSGLLSIFIALGLVALHIFQLVPLPSGWIFDASVGTQGPTKVISRVPHGTAAALASLIPPLVIFLLTIACTTRQRQTLITVCLALGSLSIVTGLVQVAQGPASIFRFYEVTNPSEAVGYFANRNHFAAWMCIILVFVLIWLSDRTGQLTSRSHVASGVGIEVAAGFAMLMATLVTLAMARSRAGIFLAMIAILVLAIVYWTSSSDKQSSTTKPHRSRWYAAIVSLSVLIALQFGLQRVLTRFGTDPLDDLRWPLANTGIAMVQSYLPFGSGVGSFVQVYGVAERTTDLFGGFANRAHNDWIEFAIEGGAPALFIMLGFIVWYVVRLFSMPAQTGAARLQHLSGAMIVGLLLLHSIVDYPLRTIALSSMFAFACALLLPPPSRNRDEHRTERAHQATSSATIIGEERSATRVWTPIANDRDWPDDWR